MLHIPILRHGKPYKSVDAITLVHHATGEPVATVSQANPGLVSRDLSRMDDAILESIPARDLLALCRKAAALFMSAELPLGESSQSFDDYVRQLSATTGMPEALCRNNAAKIHRVLDEIDAVVAGLTRGFDLAILDRGFGNDEGRMLSWYRAGRIFGAVLPSNSPGVHSLWIPAIALKAPIALKPGREEPWSPWRIVQALIAAGVPREAFGFYPTDHAGAASLLMNVDRAMLFGDAATTRAWAHNPKVELHGPGYSKVILGPDAADHFADHLDLIESSIAANGGRSCINTSAVYTPRHGRALADALAKRLATWQALPATDPNARLAAFANPAVPQRISASIDAALRAPGATDLTALHRGTDRLVTQGRCAWLLPTIIWCEDPAHPLAAKEFLFPYAAVVECPVDDIPRAVGPTLVATVITQDQSFIRRMMGCGHVDRLNVGPIPTWRLSWDQPHEGNLFEHLYRQRAFQIEGVA